jgi:pimeloyl-ACP methyl ester carboxylesterase
MAYFIHEGIRFHYIDLGEGTPFVFQHGLGGSTEQIQNIFIPPAGIRLLSFDFRGHGETNEIGPEEKLGFETFGSDLAAFLDHLNLEKAIIGGISMGAAVSLNFVLRYPSRTTGSVFSRPAWLDQPMNPEIRDLFREVARLIRGMEPQIGRYMLATYEPYLELARKSPAAAESFLSYFDYPHAKTTAVKYLAMPADQPCLDRRLWKNIKTPVLVMANSMDPVHPMEYGKALADGILQAEYKELTPKTIDSNQHRKDVQQYLETFLKQYDIKQ